MQVYIYNTMTRRKEPFRPIDTGKVRMYNCGPTVYDQAHIGNMRTYVMADVIRRGFEHLGYEVRQVMNITDVGHLTSDADEGEDRMLVGARRTGRDPWEIAARYSELFFEDCAALNILRPHVVCKATEHIPEMIDLVQRLADRGYTYEIGDGIYFDVGRFPEYGRLSGQTLDTLRAGARVAVNPEKRHPADFALWRKATREHIMQWDSPWGRGYPGWHIECSAMSMMYLGETLDIHTGGEDHIAIHHPNEIAQSEAATGRPFVHYWVHGRFLRWSADERRMSKRSGEFLVVDDLTERGYDPLAFRYHCLTASYRVPLTFSWDGLDRAAEGLGRMQENVRRLAGEVGPDKTGHAPASGPSSRLAEQSVCELPSEQFAQAVADDLDMPSALAVTWETIHQANRATDAADQRALLDLVIKFDRILGLGLAGAAQDGGAALPIAIVALVKQREAARSARDWATADALRQAIRQQGYELEDTPTGTRWRHLPANREGSR